MQSKASLASPSLKQCFRFGFLDNRLKSQEGKKSKVHILTLSPQQIGSPLMKRGEYTGDLPPEGNKFYQDLDQRMGEKLRGTNHQVKL